MKKKQNYYHIGYVIKQKNDNEATLIINKKVLWNFLKNYQWDRSHGFIYNFIKGKKMFFSSNNGEIELFSTYTTLDGGIEKLKIADNNLLRKIFSQICNLEIVSLNYKKEKEKVYHFGLTFKPK